FSPLKYTSPLSCTSKPATIRNKVLFPEPLSPTNDQTLPFFIFREKLVRAWLSLSYCLDICLIESKVMKVRLVFFSVGFAVPNHKNGRVILKSKDLAHFRPA